MDRQRLRPVSRTNPIPVHRVQAPAVSCTRCESPDTEPVMMRHHTCDAGEWFRCKECGHTFTAPSAWPL
jgi:hypothetical protein